MDRALKIAIISVLANIMFSTMSPLIVDKIRNRKMPTLNELRDVDSFKLTFDAHRHVIITSSILIGIVSYLAVNMEPETMPTIPYNVINFN